MDLGRSAAFGNLGLPSQLNEPHPTEMPGTYRKYLSLVAEPVDNQANLELTVDWSAWTRLGRFGGAMMWISWRREQSVQSVVDS